MSQQEEWRPIAGFPGYEVSSSGRIVSYRRRQPRILRGSRNERGYPIVALARDGKPHTKTVHTIVATAFHGPCPDGMETRHLNGERDDNRAANLAWGTKSENMRDRVAHGNDPNANKTECSRQHPLNEINTYRSPDGKRACRACARARDRRRRERRMFRAAGMDVAA